MAKKVVLAYSGGLDTSIIISQQFDSSQKLDALRGSQACL
jgi:argininosuccinate synthase